jgi:mono/diheme cytochrome c family protein
VIVLLAAGAAGFAWSGIFDVSAAIPEPQWRAQLFGTIKDRSIDRRVAELRAAPPPLGDPQLVETGLIHFSEMCVTCHGAPGVPRSEIGMGLNPEPPDLQHEGAVQSPVRLFWVLKNGIKMTGMPAFGRTHTDEQLWSMVAFLEQLPKLNPEQYAAMLKAAGVRGSRAGGEPEGLPAPGPH